MASPLGGFTAFQDGQCWEAAHTPSTALPLDASKTHVPPTPVIRRQSSLSQSSMLRRKLSMMVPGSFQGNDFDHEEEVLEAPNHRGATSATGFLRFLTEDGMGRMREAWGSRHLTADQFVETIEPILKESATEFFDEVGGRRGDVWSAEGWISSAQRAANALRQQQQPGRRSFSKQSNRNSIDDGDGPTDDDRWGTSSGRLGSVLQPQPESRQSLRVSVVGDGEHVDLFSPVHNRRERVERHLSVFEKIADEDDDGDVPKPRVSRLASTQSIRAFLDGDSVDEAFSCVSAPSPHNSTFRGRTNSAQSSLLAAGGVQQTRPHSPTGDEGGEDFDASVVLEGSVRSHLAAMAAASPPSSGRGGRRMTSQQQQQRRGSGFFHATERRGSAGGGETSELRQYLHNLFAFIDHRRTHKMPWDVFSSFLVNGITGAGGGRGRTQGGTTTPQQQTCESPTGSNASTSPRRQHESNEGDHNSSDDSGSDDEGLDSDEEAANALHHYRLTAEVPLPLLRPVAPFIPSSVTAQSGVDMAVPPQAAAAAPQSIAAVHAGGTKRREWVQVLQYLEDIDKLFVVMKFAVSFIDPITLQGSAAHTTSEGGMDGGGGGDWKAKAPSGEKRSTTMRSSGAVEDKNSVIGNPSASCLPLHVVPSMSRITAALFLPDPFWAVAILDTDRGVSSVSIWQYQVAPARAPELLLKSKLFSSFNDSCMITSCLYTRPVTEAERLGLPSAFTMLECVVLLGTRDGRVLALTIVKNVSNASKPVYTVRPTVEVLRHRDVVSVMLHLQHSGCVCTASLDGTVMIFERKRHDEYKTRGSLRFHKLGVTSLAYARDTLTLFTAGHEGIVAAWSENQWTTPSYILRDHNHNCKGPIVSIQCIPQTNIVSTFDSGGTLRFYDTRDRRVVFDLSVVDPQVIASGVVRREDLRKDVDDGGIHTAAALGVAGSVNHRRTAGTGLFASMCFTGSVHRQFLFAGSHIYVASASEELKRNPLCTYDIHRPIVHASMSSVFGVITTSNAEITLWSLKNGLPDTQHRHVTQSPITSVACRTTCDVIFLGQESGLITAVQTSTGTVLQQYSCHDQTIAGLSLHPTKPLLVSACRGVEGLLCFWHDERLLSLRAVPAVQNSQTQSVHPQQVVPLSAVHPVIFTSFDPTGAVVAVASPQRIVFYARHPKFPRWVEVQSIFHGNVTEMNAFAWLGAHQEAAGDVAQTNGDGGARDDHFRIFVGDGRGYVMLWELIIDRDADDIAKGSSHVLVHLGNNVSTTDRFFAAKRQKLKALARQKELQYQQKKHRRLGGEDDALSSCGLEAFGAMAQSVESSDVSHHHHHHHNPSAAPAPAAVGKSSASLLNAHTMLDDLGDVSNDPEIRALLELQDRSREEQLRGNDDPASKALRKRLRARQSMDALTKRLEGESFQSGPRASFGADSSVEEIRASSAQMQLQRELELIRTEAALRERRRAEEEGLLLACSAGGGGGVEHPAHDPAPLPEHGGGDAMTPRPNDERQSGHCRKLSRQAERKRQARKRRLTKAGLFSMAQLQQMELAAASPTLSTMDAQLALALERQQHERTQAIKHFHPTGPTQAISGEELLAPPILCIAADGLYAFLLYTGDEAGRLVVWYVGSADPFISVPASIHGDHHSPAASWLKEPQPIARTSPHGEGVPVFSVSSCRKPFHAVVSWGGDNCVVLSTWSGLVLGRLQQGPIPDRRWALGPLLTAFNEKTFTVQLLWMKLKRFVLEGYFSASHKPPSVSTSAGGAVVGSAFALAVETHRQRDSRAMHPEPTSNAVDGAFTSFSDRLPTLSVDVSDVAPVQRKTTLGAALFGDDSAGGGEDHMGRSNRSLGGRDRPNSVVLLVGGEDDIGQDSRSSSSFATAVHRQPSLFCGPAVTSRQHSTDSDDDDDNFTGDYDSHGRQTRMRRSSSSHIARRAPPKVSMPVGLRRYHQQASTRLDSPPPRSRSPPRTAAELLSANTECRQLQSPARGHGQDPATLLELAAQDAFELILRKRTDIPPVVAPPGGRKPGASSPAVQVEEQRLSAAQAHDDVEPLEVCSPSWLSEITSTPERTNGVEWEHAHSAGANTSVTDAQLGVAERAQSLVAVSRLPAPSPLVAFASCAKPADQGTSAMTRQNAQRRSVRRSVPLPTGRVLTTSLLPSWLREEVIGQAAVGPRRKEGEALPSAIASITPVDESVPRTEEFARLVEGEEGDRQLLRSMSCMKEEQGKDDVAGAPALLPKAAPRRATLKNLSERLRAAAAASTPLPKSMLPEKEKKPGVQRATSSLDSLRVAQDDNGEEDDEEDEVERAIRESRDKKRSMQLASRRVEVNKRRHDAVHATQATLRQTLAEIDKARSAAAVGRTPYYDADIDAHNQVRGVQDIQEGGVGRLVFSRRAIISKIPPTARRGGDGGEVSSTPAKFTERIATPPKSNKNVQT